MLVDEQSLVYSWTGASQEALVVKNLPANAGDIRDVGSIPGSGRSPGGERGNPLQYSCLGNPMEKGTWWATVQFSSVQSLSCVWLFATPWTATRQASLSIINSWSLLKLVFIESVMPSHHLILCCLLLLLPSIFPSIKVFSSESGLQLIGLQSWHNWNELAHSKQKVGLSRWCYGSRTHLPMQEVQGMFHPWVGKRSWRRTWQPTPIFLPGTLQSIESPKVRHDWSNLACVHAHTRYQQLFPFMFSALSLKSA